MKRHPQHKGLWWIAAFKLLKGFLLIAVAVGALRLLHHDIKDLMERLVEAIRVDPHHRIVSGVVERVGALNDHRLKIISLVSFGYAGLLLTEGVGLFLEKRWAEFLTIFITASLVPLEVYELVQHRSPLKFVALAINVAVVIYLVRLVRKERSA